MNLLHVHSGNLFGGVERMLETLAPATSGRDPIASSFALAFEGRVADALRAAAAEVHPLGEVQARRPDSVLRARRALRQLLCRGNWDVASVHSSWAQAVFGREILRAGLPLVRWLHAPQPGPTWLERWASRAPATLVVCNSNYTHEAARTRLAAAAVAVHHPPSVMPPLMTRHRGDVRAELGTAEETVVIAMAARFERGKGHHGFIEALSALPVNGWEAWVLGGAQTPVEDDHLTSLRAQSATAGLEGRIRFLGHRGDVSTLLTAADIYCQPNETPDSFGLSFVEALAAGLPIVTTRLGGAPEIVDSSCGVLTDPGSSNAVTAALQRLIESAEDRHTMSAAARVRAEQFCDLPKSLNALAAHLTRALAPALLSR